MIRRFEPMSSGRETEIDMIERQMEGGVVVIQPADVHEHSEDERLGGLIRVEADVKVSENRSRVRAAPKG